MNNLSGWTLFLAFLGALGLVFGCYTGFWFVAHWMAWWTFALLATGSVVFWATVKSIINGVRQ